MGTMAVLFVVQENPGRLVGVLGFSFQACFNGRSRAVDQA